MNSYTIIMYSILTILTSIAVVSTVVSLCKIVYAYIRKGADLRTCLIAQGSLFFFVFVAEAIYYFITGRMNQFCICSCKIFSLVVGFLFVCSKFIGKPSIKISSSTKNSLFILCCTAFYVCIILTSLTLKQTPAILITQTKFLSFERLVQLATAIRWDCFSVPDKSIDFLMKNFYTFGPIVFFVLALIIDLFEKESKKRIIIDGVMLYCSLLSMTINKEIFDMNSSIAARCIDLFFIFIMFLIPMICFSIEADDIYKDAMENSNVTLIKKVYESYLNPKKNGNFEKQKSIARKVIANSRIDDPLQKELRKRKYRKFLADLS